MKMIVPTPINVTHSLVHGEPIHATIVPISVFTRVPCVTVYADSILLKTQSSHTMKRAVFLESNTPFLYARSTRQTRNLSITPPAPSRSVTTHQPCINSRINDKPFQSRLQERRHPSVVSFARVKLYIIHTYPSSS